MKTSPQARPTVIRWAGGGKEVYIAGSFNSWNTKIPLNKRYRPMTPPAQGPSSLVLRDPLSCMFEMFPCANTPDSAVVLPVCLCVCLSVAITTLWRSWTFRRESTSTSSLWTASGSTTRQR